MMVAEMMILAGQAVGQVGAAAGLPLPYRGQEPPRLPSDDFLNALPDGPCRGFALRKCMTRSVVSPEPVRHASLALDAYVQVTSPIRRYTDIIAHFNIKVGVCVCVQVFVLCVSTVFVCLRVVCGRVVPHLPLIVAANQVSRVSTAAPSSHRAVAREGFRLSWGQEQLPAHCGVVAAAAA